MHDKLLLNWNKKVTTTTYPNILSERIPVLDGYRGLAVLLVMCYHYIPSFFFGWVGVDLFFVLSGFLITSILMNANPTRNYLAVYFARRLLRIVPVYFLTLLLLFIILPLVAPALITDSFRELILHQEWYWLFGINIFQAINGFPDNITTVHFWSLACEMQFYIIWPVVIGAFRNNMQQLLVALILLILLSIVFRIAGTEFFTFNPIYRYVLLPSRLDAFCLGGLLFLFVSSSVTVPKQILYLIAAIMVIAAVILSMYDIRWHFTDSFVDRVGLTMNGIFWFAILSVGMKFRYSFASAIGSNWLLRKAGIYSYGMYIFHLPVGILLSRISIFSTHGETGMMILILKTVASFSVTIIISIASYHLFEKKIMALKPGYHALKN